MPVSLRDFAANVFPCGEHLVEAKPLTLDTPIYPQDSLTQQRKNLTNSLENNLPLDIATQFMENHIVPAQAKNDALNLISTTQYNRQRRDLDLGQTNDNSVQFSDERIPEYEGGTYEKDEGVYNRPDEWLSPNP
jgi:hypothetical protein